jgi:hypothetical protein
MIFKTIKLVSKVATTTMLVKTGYNVYKKGNVVYQAYKTTKKMKAKKDSFLNIMKNPQKLQEEKMNEQENDIMNKAKDMIGRNKKRQAI